MSRILVIDDDLNLLQMVKLMLERVGHEVQIANEGERGIVAAGQTQPDLAIIDVMMPGLSGYDVVRRLRKDPLTAHIPIIILTARSQPMDKAMALEAGANAFLSKPVTAQELIDRRCPVRPPQHPRDNRHHPHRHPPGGCPLAQNKWLRPAARHLPGCR